MENELFVTLALTGATVGALHSIAPDHWVPFAALARARKWSGVRTASVTLMCGFGHVTVSVLLGIIGLFVGASVLEAFGNRLGSIATISLVVFGVLYAIWGIRRAVGIRLHGHAHSHYDHVHDETKTTEWTLFLIFCADPCVAVIPIMFAAASLPVTQIVGIVLVYEIATIGAMIALVLPARSGIQLIRGEWFERYGHAAAGVLIAFVGVAMIVFGI
ncbi:MAG: hypothetical protein R3338_10965 [Thermoanaerobaculia bacterium]|nr:hypothetical protein [Thermoanaerobaculia bacterium]